MKTTAAPTHATYCVELNCRLDLCTMVALGSYDATHPGVIPEHFPITGAGQEKGEIILLHFGRDRTSEQVLSEMNAQDHRPARIEELLALGAQHPSLQREYPIIGLGSVCRISGGRHIACLIGNRFSRRLHLFWLVSVWWHYCRFAAVAK